MEFTLKLIPIETIVKKNYYILIDNNLLKVENIDYILRGYERFDKKLEKLGVKIQLKI